MIPWDEAVHVAAQVSEHLAPWCSMSKCAGSVRRKRPTCRDIEFVVAPHMVGDLFGELQPITQPIQEALLEIGTWVKGGDRYMVISDVLGHPHLRLELHLVHPPAQWGSILAIRTGPAGLGEYAMKAMRARGYRHQDGYVRKGAEVVPTETEEQFFALAGIPCVPAAKRDALLEKLRAGHHIRRVG